MQAVFAGVLHEERPLRWIDGKNANSERPGGPQARLQAAAGQRGGNEEHFAPTPARAVRFTILATSDNAQPCLDELEIYEAGVKNPAGRNVALASASLATSSGNFEGNPLHKLEHINDGRFGNGRSWISSEPGRGWVQIDFPKMVTIDRIVWSRDRQKQYMDRLPVQYTIEISHEPISLGKSGIVGRSRAVWHAVASEGMVYGGRFVQPGPTYRLNRGDPMQPREPVLKLQPPIKCYRV